MSSAPLVTIGIPTFNEEKFLAATLENLLKQTYPNIEILIADNGSTDRTSEIAAEYAGRHKNIRHIRRPENIGQNANFNALPHEASGTYFCWFAGHDLLAPDFVEKCVGVLESDPSIVLAFPRTIETTEDGVPIREVVRRFDIRTMSPERRFREVMWRVDCNYVYGMWRRQPMIESKLFQLFPAADRVFLAEMALKGAFAPAPTIRYCRANRGTVPQTEIAKRHRLMKYIYPHRTFTDRELEGNEFYLPTMQAFRRTAREADVSLFARMCLLFSIRLCAVMKFHLFPGADTLSWIVLKTLPTPLLRMILRRMK